MTKPEIEAMPAGRSMNAMIDRLIFNQEPSSYRPVCDVWAETAPLTICKAALLCALKESQ